MKIVSFYTVGTPYEQEAEKLRESAHDHGLDIDILGVPNRGSWDLNTKWKPFVILRAMNIYDDDILYVDADATFHGVPEINITANIAAHIMDKAYWGQSTEKRKHSLMSGTLWFANTEKARDILLFWQNENEFEPRKWDQHNLETVTGFDPQTGKSKENVYNLECEYCAIDRTMHGIDNAIIRHHQASRKLRRKIG